MVELPETIMEEEDVVKVAPFSRFPTYVTPRKVSVKVPKDLDKVRSYINMPLIRENVPLENDMFAKVP